MAEPPPPPAISFQQVSRTFGRQRALDAVSFDVKAGECFGLVGGNGAGKTTLLKCLLDFIVMDSGRIDIWGAPHQQTSAHTRITFLPERLAPPYYLRGEDFMRYMLSLHGQPFHPQRVRDIFDALELPLDALAKAVRSYSKGMSQKLGLAACFLSDKPLLILDEPTTGLDPKARVLFKQRIKDAVAKGRSVFMTSHALADVDEMCHRMAVLHQGQLRFVGKPAELRELHHAETLEAAFLDSIAAI